MADMPENDGIQTQEPSASIPEPGNGSAAPDNGGAQAGTQPAGSFVPTDWAINYKGQKVLPKDRQHLINMAQKGYDYNQTMAQLKREREEFERVRGSYKPYEDMDARFQKDPKFKAALMSWVAEYNSRLAGGMGGEEGGAGMQIPPEVMQKLEQLERFQQETTQRNADEALQREIRELRDNYKHVDFDADTDGEGNLMRKIIKHAHDNNIANLKTAYRDYMYDADTTNARADALRRAEAERAERARQGKVAGGSAPKAPVTDGDKYRSGDTYADIEAKALKRLGG
jgi:hypothetical protein